MPPLRAAGDRRTSVDAAVIDFLASAPGRTAIATASGSLAAGATELSVISALRRTFDPPVAAAVLEQAALRPRAHAKLGARGDEMVLLREPLEQASRAEVSAHRAQRMSGAGVDTLTDAGAGIGADSIAFAAAGIRVRAIERDPVVAAALRANAAGRGIEVVEGDALEHLPGEGAVYFDPARRAGGRRIFDPEACSPPLSALVAAHGRGLQVIAKMSPSLKLDQVPPGWDADWVSTQTEQGRSVVEAVLWSPPIGADVVRAIVMRGEEAAVLSGPRAAAREPSSGPLGRFVYEPDGAVSQSGLTASLAEQLGAHALQPSIAYLSGDQAAATAFAQAFEVVEALPWSKRALARALASHDASDLVVKKRGVHVDPTALRRELLPRLRSRDGEPLVVLLAPVRGRPTAILARSRRA